MELTVNINPTPTPKWDELTPEEQEKIHGIKNVVGFMLPDGSKVEAEAEPIPYENCPVKQMFARAMVNARQ